VGVVGSPDLETHGSQKATPTASTAKLITALVVLRAKPLAPGQPGPVITLTPSDVAIYNAYFVHDSSLVKVRAAERITEYQMLQAMLLPSANNMADSLAIWAFGSLKAYSGAANSYLAQLGLAQTKVGTDASGFAPSTTSTARDLVRIGELVMQNPVLAQIVGQPGASGIPVVNNIKNVNFLLGSDGVVGIKTGNTDQSGGVFVSASKVQINGEPVTIVTTLAGSPSLFQALKDSLPLIKSAQANFKPVKPVTKGTVVGHYKLPWGGSVAAVASKNLSLTAWNGSSVTSTTELQPVAATAQAGQTAGSIKVSKSAVSKQISVPVKLQTAPTTPSLWWRLFHPFN
jgi:D-alanyl-D-alanine carboxypeptidase (penicillin-binding protein 5/6)